MRYCRLKCQEVYYRDWAQPSLNTIHLSCLSSRHLSCLSTRHLSCLRRKHQSRLNNTLFACQKLAKGPTHAIVTDLDNRTVTRGTDPTPQDRIAVRFEWASRFGELLKNPKNKNGNGVNMSGSRHTPKLGKVVGNGLRMVARGCHGSPEVLAGLKRCLQTVPGPGGTARGQFWRNRGVPAASSILGSAAWRSHSIK